jgi:hypothetical protein
LVIHGREDRIVVEEEVEFLADGIAGAALAFHALYRSGRQRAHGR